MKAIRIFLLILIILGVGLLVAQGAWVPPLTAWILDQEGAPVPVVPSAPVSTTTEAAKSKTPRPVAQKKGMIEGKVLLGPTCPVERIPPDPACAPKGYQTSIRVQPASSPASFTTISSDASGAFSVSLDPGSYTLKPQGSAAKLPLCREAQVTVSAGQTLEVNLDCDSGIR